MSVLGLIRRLVTLGRGVVGGLTEADAPADPIALFRRWFDEARRAGLFLPEAMTVATATPDGVPSARMMLLKGVDTGGFVFYTNHGSRKAGELERNPRAALVFHWSALERQVRVEGRVERISQAESEAYFRTRPRGSQIAAWASRQSESLASRAALEQRVREAEARFGDGDVPLPEFWGGYRVRPDRIEFWQGRLNRLHDRLRYTRAGDEWRRERLFP